MVLAVTCVFSIIGLPTGIAAWVMGHRDLAMMREGVKDPAGRGLTQGGWICAIIGTCLNVMSVLASLAMVCLMIIGFMASPTPAPGPAPAPVTRPAPQRKMEMDLGRQLPAPFRRLSEPRVLASGGAPRLADSLENNKANLWASETRRCHADDCGLSDLHA